VARAIYTEVKEGRGTPHGGVLLDVSHMGAATVRRKLPSMYDQFMELAGVDITREPMEVGPTCHYFMGGIRVDAETGASTVEGLFATGECSGGMNGANRLGGNSLSDLLVFGRRAGDAAAQHGGQAPRLDRTAWADAADEMTRYLTGPGDEDPYRLHAQLQMTMQEDVGIFRDEAGLSSAIARLDELERRAADARSASATAAFNPGWHLCRDLRNMLVVSQAVARAAHLRRESRGAHSRLDFPAYDDHWAEHNIVVRKDADGGMQVQTRPVVKAERLATLIEERKAAERA
jgi:succinate dehydrogenase / fumarate reductase flavoprotein subunit